VQTLQPDHISLQCAQHHDFRRLPNGNTIFLGWEVVPPEIADRIPGGLAGTSHPDGCMYGDNIFEITPEGKTVWEWHACRDMEVEKYPLFPNQLRDEFAHANAIFPVANGDIYISFRRLNMIGLIDKQTKKMKWQHRDDSFGMQHDCTPLPNGIRLLTEAVPGFASATLGLWVENAGVCISSLPLTDTVTSLPMAPRARMRPDTSTLFLMNTVGATFRSSASISRRQLWGAIW